MDWSGTRLAAWDHCVWQGGKECKGTAVHWEFSGIAASITGGGEECSGVFSALSVEFPESPEQAGGYPACE